MKDIDTTKKDFDVMEEWNLYSDGKAKLTTMPYIPREVYLDLLKEVDDLLEEHGLEIVTLNVNDYDPEPGVAFRIEKREGK